tara:strand:- start:74 stop:862 length:789 start_codon:yes stop_codon:yes gene_type:complete
MEMEISPPAIEIIKEYETLQLTAYQDGESISIGYGHSNLSGGEQFELGDTITEEEADKLLLEDLKEIERIVNQRMKNYNVTFTQGQYDGMVVGTFNRPEQLKSKSLYETIASGDADAITEVWNNTVSDKDKENYPGLVDRQAAELSLINKKEVTTDTTATIEGEPNPDYESPQGNVPGFDPSQPTKAQRVSTPYLNPSQMYEYTSQVPLAAQNTAYGRVRQMLEAQVNKQKKAAGHAPLIPGVGPAISFSDAVAAALKLLGR